MTNDLPLPPRLSAAFIFALAIVSLRLQFDASHVEMRSISVSATLWAMAGYFTVLTNLVVAVMMALVAMRWQVPGRLAFAVTVAIVMVGLVYHTLLAGLVDPVGMAWWADQGLHTAVPALTLVWWLLFAPEPGKGVHGTALIWPLAYLTYALTRGALTGFWPYPFLDVGRLGWLSVSLNCAGMVLAFVAVSAILITAKRRLG
ncbi:MAG: Pr6Pr family membrane protein [Pseudotabrizicola sp.]|uniref:Pr6Pr family membrane protein n=1 Tax=Pseudotabrizicola sp. TaxID=2939647 RepID=UPI00271C3F24|nr:Pr6Pr family membrane protein [Pseudotabrizicola sp.]MDO8883420.1 Pr6Pr family membrane protein [Pseudotabrizicola sp.]MDP2082339.1 Pr6Pr family membrane protein [Pseudotabrizicola sp.]MDZ7574335.1 Pr6Pr family membrane protein [Pseudotabrizicola sp.]